MANLGREKAKRKLVWRAGASSSPSLIQTGMTVMTGGFQGGGQSETGSPAPLDLVRRIGSGNCRGSVVRIGEDLNGNTNSHSTYLLIVGLALRPTRS